MLKQGLIGCFFGIYLVTLIVFAEVSISKNLLCGHGSFLPNFGSMATRQKLIGVFRGYIRGYIGVIRGLSSN